MFHVSQSLIKREHKTTDGLIECDGIRHFIMKEARKGCYRRVAIVLKKKLGTSKRLKDNNILAVKFYYCTLKNNSDQEAIHEITDRICDAGEIPMSG